MATTQRELLRAALEARGYSVDPQRCTAKYVAMRRGDHYYWLGKSGGLREGRIISQSVGVPESTRQKLLREAKGN